MRWKCAKCFDYDLCTPCYMSDKHSVEHAFVRFDSVGNRYVYVFSFLVWLCILCCMSTIPFWGGPEQAYYVHTFFNIEEFWMLTWSSFIKKNLQFGYTLHCWLELLSLTATSLWAWHNTPMPLNSCRIFCQPVSLVTTLCSLPCLLCCPPFWFSSMTYMNSLVSVWDSFRLTPITGISEVLW